MSKLTAPTWKMERRTLASLRPFEHNPRRIMEKPLADLTKSISKFGLAEPLVIQPCGLLIGGHARYQVLLAQGVKEADCYVPDRALSQKDMIELNIRLNKNQAGEWDFDLLSGLPDIDVADLVEFGFQEWELGIAGAVNDPNAEWQGMPEFKQDDESPFRTIAIHFRNAEDVESFSKLIGQPIGHKTKWLYHPPQVRAVFSDQRHVSTE